MNEKTIEQQIQEEQTGIPVMPEGETQAVSEESSINLADIMTRPTGEGQIEDYLQHPLNLDSTLSSAKIIRGLTGLIGGINYWWTDVIIGIWQKWQEKRQESTRM